MARRYRVTFDKGALADLAEIQTYMTAARDEHLAEDFVSQFVRYCESFRTIPHRGARFAIDGLELRTVSWKHGVTIAFRVSDTAELLIVLAVLYRGRDVRTALSKRFED